MDTLHVDCDNCRARGPSCDDCVITVLLGPLCGAVDLDATEQATLSAMADQGLVPPLRLIPGARRVQPIQTTLEWRDYA